MRDGFSISPLGRVRYFKEGGREQLNAAINAPVQGTASDLMQLAIADIQGLLHERGRGKVEDVSVVGTVHDSAVLELPTVGWEAKALEVKERMENLNPLLSYLGVQFDVPITVEYTVGTRWSLTDVGKG
jgi:DNA polymerase I-like protein with 3'-5' exonuclease and polymerase domains